MHLDVQIMNKVINNADTTTKMAVQMTSLVVR